MTEPYDQEDEAARHGESVESGLLPTPERIETMDRSELVELRDLLADWEGPGVETFRERVRERLADTAGADSEGGEE